MSNPDSSPAPPPPQLPPPERSGCLTAIMILIGIVLLLPGLCALVFGALSLSEPGSASGIVPFVVLGLIVGFFGVMLIWAAIRGSRR
jgi:hypothetical protein